MGSPTPATTVSVDGGAFESGYQHEMDCVVVMPQTLPSPAARLTKRPAGGTVLRLKPQQYASPLPRSPHVPELAVSAANAPGAFGSGRGVLLQLMSV
jgi:hypothetical protein